MKVTKRIDLRRALYTVLLCASPMLPAEGGAGAHSAIQPPVPMHPTDEAGAPESPLRLTTEQLDSIVAGQVVELQIPGTITIPTLGTLVIQLGNGQIVSIGAGQNGQIVSIGAGQNGQIVSIGAGQNVIQIPNGTATNFTLGVTAR